MIIFLLLRWALEVFSALNNIIIPALPQGVQTVLYTVFDYMVDGMDIIAFFIDLGYCARLLGWFMAISATLLTIELIYGIWHKVTGNASSEAYSETNTVTTDADGNKMRSHSTRHTTSHRNKF